MLANILMKPYLFIFILLLTSCFPSMQNGPDPHSIKFEEVKFNQIIIYFTQNNSVKNFSIDDPPSDFPEDILDEMKKIGFDTYRNIGQNKVFTCGSGVVGKCWGFIYGDFSSEDVQHPPVIGNEDKLYLTYLEKLKGNWYRFGA